MHHYMSGSRGRVCRGFSASGTACPAQGFLGAAQTESARRVMPLRSSGRPGAGRGGDAPDLPNFRFRRPLRKLPCRSPACVPAAVVPFGPPRWRRPAIRVQPRPSWWKRLRNGWFVSGKQPGSCIGLSSPACGLTVIALGLVVGSLHEALTTRQFKHHDIFAAPSATASAGIPRLRWLTCVGRTGSPPLTEKPPSAGPIFRP